MKTNCKLVFLETNISGFTSDETGSFPLHMIFRAEPIIEGKRWSSCKNMSSINDVTFTSTSFYITKSLRQKDKIKRKFSVDYFYLSM